MTTALPDTSLGEEMIVTTAELQELIAQGYEVYLPEVQTPEAGVLEHYDEQDTARLDTPAADNPVVSVEYVRDEPVQCISVEHEEHLYISDDFIPTHNTSNIVFLKSTDDSMIETLSKMSGTTHRVYRDSKTVTRDVEKLFLQTEGKVSYTSTAKEEAVISYNDLAYLPERNSVVFRAGDSPIWNRNETILPMSWKLFGGDAEKTIVHYGEGAYTLQTIPTMSTAIDFDVNQNQPNFAEMVESRLRQASKAERAVDIHAKAHGLDAFEIDRLKNDDTYADAVLDIIRTMLRQEAYLEQHGGVVPEEDFIDEHDDTVDMVAEGEVGRPVEAALLYEAQDKSLAEGSKVITGQMVDNEEFRRDQMQAEAQMAEDKVRRYAQGRISRDMLYDRVRDEAITGVYDQELIMAFLEIGNVLGEDPEFSVRDGQLYSRDGLTAYITKRDEGDDIDIARAAAQDEDTLVYGEDEVFDTLDVSASNMYTVHREFKNLLVSYDDWQDILEGRFDEEVARAITMVEKRSGSSSDITGTEYAVQS